MKIMGAGPVIEELYTVLASSSSQFVNTSINGWDLSVSTASLNVDTYTLHIYSTTGNNNIGISKSSSA